MPPSVAAGERPRVLTAFRVRGTPKHVLTAPGGLRDAEEWLEDHARMRGYHHRVQSRGMSPVGD